MQKSHLLKITGFLFILLILCSSVYASIDIRGVVVDKETQKPIPGVKIKYKHATEDKFVSGTITDSAGKFKMLHFIDSGIMELRLEAENYGYVKEELFLNSIDIKKVKLELKKMDPEDPNLLVFLQRFEKIVTYQELVENLEKRRYVMKNESMVFSS